MTERQQPTKENRSKVQPETIRTPDQDEQFISEVDLSEHSVLAPDMMSSSRVLYLQRTIGNAAVQRLMAGSVSHSKERKNAVPNLSGKKKNDKIVQRNLQVNGERRYITKTAWPHVSGLAPITALGAPQRTEAKNILDRWIHRDSSYVREGATSENREYASWAELAEALAGEVRSAANLATEGVLSGQAQASVAILAGVAGFMNRLQLWHGAQAPAMQQDALHERGRYRIYYGTSRLEFVFGKGATLDDALIQNLPASMNERIAIASDYALFARDYVLPWNMVMTVAQGNARSTHWNPDESAPWTINARINNVPLSAGPSGKCCRNGSDGLGTLLVLQSRSPYEPVRNTSVP